MIHEDLTEPRSGEINGDEVHLALKRVLVSRPFRSSNQCSSLLRYIVEHTLTREENLLRERVIGTELFGRPADYETSEDPVVRLRASEVRKRLAQYYLSDRDPRIVRIDIPPGSYRATFRWNSEAPVDEVRKHSPGPTAEFSSIPDSFLLHGQAVDIEDRATRPDDDSHVGKRISSGRQSAATIAAIALLILVVTGFFAAIRVSSSEKGFKAFWAPWMNSPKPVIISVGSNAVYRLQFDYVWRYSKDHGLENQGQEIFIPPDENGILAANQFFPARNSFVALGDVAAVSDVVAMLTRNKKDYQERFPDDVSFAELRSAPAVLVGGFNNSMTLELGKRLEFVMRNGNEITDTLNPNRKWFLNAPEIAGALADYAIITRIVQRDGDSPVVSVAGLGQYGTSAAAELVSSPTDIHIITDRLQKDWAKKNLQVVLRIRVIDFKPTVSEVVAFRSW